MTSNSDRYTAIEWNGNKMYLREFNYRGQLSNI